MDEDHLHIRGEYIGFFGERESRLGSPPHTWRIHVGNAQETASLRITSTYVENTILSG